MKFWKEHMALRSLLILIFVVAGLALVFVGWSMTGQMSGLILLLTALLLYNKPFEDPKTRK